MSATSQWSYGDRVVHPGKPEWGHGVITAASAIVHEGKPCQRVTVRFDRAGVKVLSTAFAELKPAAKPEPAVVASSAPNEPEQSAAAKRFSSSGGSEGSEMLGPRRDTGPTAGSTPGSTGGWLDSIKPVSPAETLVKMPDSTTDPFTTLGARLKATLNLYKFTDAGASLLDWAAAQTGLKDPLSVFSRHELEQVYRRFTFVRDDHLKKLMLDARRQDPGALLKAAREAPPAGQQAMRRIDASR